jgi:hypothetical protein
MNIRNLRDFLLYGPFRAAFAGDPSRHYYYERRHCRPSREDDPRDYNRGHWRHWQRWRGWEDHPWSGMPGGPRARFFESGEVRLAILSLLKDAPKHVLFTRLFSSWKMRGLSSPRLKRVGKFIV